MTANRKDISNLKWQHKAIKDHINFLINSLRVNASQSSLKKQPEFYSSLYRWSLYDLRETIRRHIELDERIFKMLPGNAPIKHSGAEHGKLQKQVDSAILLAENAVFNELSPEDLKNCSSETIAAFDKVCKSVKEHVDEEDKILEFLQED